MPDFVLTPLDEEDEKNAPQQVPTGEGDTFSPMDMGDFVLTPEQVDAATIPPTTVAGVEVPGAGLLQDVLNGGAKVIYDNIGWSPAAELTNAADSIYGWMNGKGFLEKPLRPQEMISQFAREKGLVYDEARVSELADDIGEETMQQILMAGAQLVSAGGMAALKAGDSTVRNILKSMGEFAQKHPWAVISGNVGAGAGAQIGQETGGPMGEFVGSILGSGAGATNVVPKVGKGIGAGLGAVAGAIGGLPMGVMGTGVGMAAGGITGGRIGANIADKAMRLGIPLEKAALMGANLPQDATAYARRAVEVMSQRTNRNIANVYRRLARSGSGDPMTEATALRKAVNEAYTTGQAEAGRLWGLVDQNQKAGVTNALNMTKTIALANPRTAPEFLPQDIMSKIAMLGKKAAAPKAPLPKYGGRATPPRTRRTPVTIKDLRGIQELIGQNLREENLAPRTERYLMDLNKAIDADISAVNPNDQALQTAREHTRWLHENLSRGPLGKFRGAEANAYQASQSSDLEAARALIANSEAGSTIASVSQRLNLPQLQQEATAFVRQNLAEQWEHLGPEQVAKKMASPGTQRFMEAFPRHAAEFNADMTYLSAQLADEKALNASALKAFAGKDPQAAISDLFMGGQKAGKVAEIKASLMGNLDAIRGLKDGVLTEFYGKAGGSPKRMAELLNVKDFRGMLSEVLGPDDMKRLDRMVRAGAELEAKGTLNGRRTMLGALVRYAGAGAARGMGAKTIQQTGTAATVSEQAINSLMSAAPARDIFTRAISDPKWERLLYSRVPTTLAELNATKELVKAVVGFTRAAQTDTKAER